MRQLYDQVTSLGNSTWVVFGYVNFHFFVTHFRFGKISFLGLETPKWVDLQTFTEKTQLNIYSNVDARRYQHRDGQGE